MDAVRFCGVSLKVWKKDDNWDWTSLLGGGGGGEKATAPKVTSKIWTISSPAKCEQSYHALKCKTTCSNSVKNHHI